LYVVYSENTKVLREISFGPQGRQLECFVPDSCSWTQLNYGQGEGQIRALGCEWGFYYSEDREIRLILHDGKISADRALEFIDAVGKKIFGDLYSSVTPIIFNDDPSL